MAAYSIGFDSAERQPWEKRQAVVGTDAPGGTLAVQIRVADGVTLNKSEIERAVRRLLDTMRERQEP